MPVVLLLISTLLRLLSSSVLLEDERLERSERSGRRDAPNMGRPEAVLNWPVRRLLLPLEDERTWALLLSFGDGAAVLGLSAESGEPCGTLPLLLGSTDTPSVLRLAPAPAAPANPEAAPNWPPPNCCAPGKLVMVLLLWLAMLPVIREPG